MPVKIDQASEVNASVPPLRLAVSQTITTASDVTSTH